MPRNESSACPLNICDGSGFVVDEATDTAFDCPCRAQRLNRARSSSLSGVIPRRYRGVSFERPPIADLDPTVVGIVREYTNDLAGNIADGRGLWFMGPNGTGKTSIAMLVSKQALDRDFSVAIYSLPRLLSEIRDSYNDESTGSYIGLLDRLTAVDLLHIDDVGAEKTSEWVLEQLYSIINSRYEDKRPVVITTNLMPDELREQIGGRTVSRLVEMCGDPLPLDGPDRRIEPPLQTLRSDTEWDTAA